MQFNEKLKELRTKKGVSQSELADSIYVSRSAVAKWENGLGLPSTESLRLLAEYFEVSVDELYSDGSTEKVIVNKNQIISRSRRLLIIISTACAVAITAIIVLAIFLGYHINKPATQGGDDWTGSIGVSGALYYGGGSSVLSERNEAISGNEIVWEKYMVSAGYEYVLKVSPSPGGHNGRAVKISADCVGFKYNADIFDIDLLHDGIEIDYALNVKQSCQDEVIWLYKVAKGEQVTDASVPSFKIIISAEFEPSDDGV
ncbi:MAG: helix-turn-helix domain-containing protein [Clostridiales bacterium]|nr:helix-turn-helix domain-containing protein [Clostridiales bacterium]